MTVYKCTGIRVDELEKIPLWKLTEYLIESVKYLGLDEPEK